MSTGSSRPLDVLVGPAEALDRSVLEGQAHLVAPRLLGVLVQRTLADGTRLLARIVETEAYGPDDPASHSVRGPTPRCRSMFEGPGTAYVYRSYGVHWCLNVSVEPAGVGAAVLLRAATAVQGLDRIRSHRPGVTGPALLRGPGCLARGLAVTGEHDGADLLGEGALTLACDDFHVRRADIVTGPRVGVSSAAQVPWRFWLDGAAATSSYRRSPRAAP